MLKQIHLSSFILITMLFVACNKEKSIHKQLSKDSQTITQKIITFGPRPVGSKAHAQVQSYIEAYLKSHAISLKKSTFSAFTPLGQKTMTNLQYTINSQQPNKAPAILLAAHYDSKYMPEKTFLGVNDAAASVALIMAMTPMIKKLELPYPVEVVFFDGEEAFKQWSKTDSLYGSRNYATQQVSKANIKYAIVLDMISDKDLSLVRSHASDPKLMKLLEKTLKEMNWYEVLDKKLSFIEDDHIPLVRAGIPTLHLMDFSFGAKHSPGPYWHTEQDNMTNVSFENTAKVGQLVLRMLDHFKQTMVHAQ